MAVSEVLGGTVICCTIRRTRASFSERCRADRHWGSLNIWPQSVPRTPRLSSSHHRSTATMEHYSSPSHGRPSVFVDLKFPQLATSLTLSWLGRLGAAAARQGPDDSREVCFSRLQRRGLDWVGNWLIVGLSTVDLCAGGTVRASLPSAQRRLCCKVAVRRSLSFSLAFSLSATRLAVCPLLSLPR